MSCMRQTATAKFIATLDQMTLSKEKHEALVRKYMRDIDICTSEARRVYALTSGEPSTNARSHALSIMRRRAILQRTVDTLRLRIASLFQHELSLEQGMLLADHISTVRQVRDTLQAITPDVDNVHDLIDTVNTMTDRVCEISELLAEPTVSADIDEADIERELNMLIGEPQPVQTPPVRSQPRTDDLPEAPSEALPELQRTACFPIHGSKAGLDQDRRSHFNELQRTEGEGRAPLETVVRRAESMEAV